MVHNIFYDKKHKEYTNICITHSYEVMSEFYKSIPELVYSLREVATIFIEDKLPKMTNNFVRRKPTVKDCGFLNS